MRIPEHWDDPDLQTTRQRIENAGPENVAGVDPGNDKRNQWDGHPAPGLFQKMEALCRSFGIPLIIDEVLVGFGRCGDIFAFQKYDIRPNMVCLSKAITGGYVPFGALWTDDTIADYYEDETLACGLTNYGHPLGLAALNGVLHTLTDPAFQALKTDTEAAFAEHVRRCARHPDVIETRCAGTMAALYLNRNACTWKQAVNNGLHLYSKDNLVILAPLTTLHRRGWARRSKH